MPPSADAEAVTVTVVNELPVLSQNADPEIVEIFLEEAADELAAISENLPQWINNPRNQEALARVRRAFHTLKGSGRMAGAMVVGEFSWAIESLLNRVIDGSIEVSGDLMAFLGQVSTPLSELISQVNGGVEPVADFRAVMEAAQKLTHGECNMLPGPGVETGITGAPAGVAAQSGVYAEDAEPELLEIFGRECRDHLNSMRTFIDGCEHGDKACHVSEPLYRALHTLAGIAESAQVPFIKMLAGELYSYFGAVEEAQQPAGRDAVEVLRACTAAMSELVDRLPDTTFDAQLLQSLQERIRCLPRIEAQEQPSGEGALFQDVPQEEPVEANGGDTGPVPYTTAPTVAVEPVAAAAADLATPARAVDHYAHLDAELLEVFLEEAGEIIESSESTLHAWVEDPGHRELINEFQRQLHTLKGGARMVDITAIGNLSHSLETLLTRVVDGHVETSDRLFGLLQHAHDRLADMFEKVKAREVPDNVEELVEQLNRLGHEDEAAVAEATVAEVAGQVESEVSTQTGQEYVAPLGQDRQDIAGTLDVPVAAVVFDAVDQVLAGGSPPDTLREGEVMPRQPERRKASRVRGEQVRVQAELLDSLVNYAGEINIYRARLDQQIGVYRFNLAELHQTINRVRDQLRQFEIETETQILHRFEREAEDRNLDFDPLEMDRYSNLQQLSRSLVETISDLHSIQELLDNTTRETESLLLQQSRVSTDLQEGLMRARMIPFAGLAPRLRRIVRQAAEELGKKVELTLDGADGEMDRNVIERIIAPLEHMLRNAVDHGIEQPGQRREAGKPETGTVRIAFHREGPEIVLQVADDGRGINHEAVRERAVERGLIAEHAQLTDSEIMQFVVQTGFSTAAKVTQISGRGVGMDVVNSEVKQLGGSLHIASSPGRGSIFTIRLPYTLAINQALLVRAGEDTYCVPLGTIEGVVRVDAEILSECYKTPGCGLPVCGQRLSVASSRDIAEAWQHESGGSAGTHTGAAGSHRRKTACPAGGGTHRQS